MYVIVDVSPGSAVSTSEVAIVLPGTSSPACGVCEEVPVFPGCDSFGENVYHRGI